LRLITSLPPSLLPSLHFSLLQIKWQELHGALDRFSAFFTCPRFDQASTEREMKAVDSEHTNNLQDDVRLEGERKGEREGGGRDLPDRHLAAIQLTNALSFPPSLLPSPLPGLASLPAAKVHGSSRPSLPQVRLGEPQDPAPSSG